MSLKLFLADGDSLQIWPATAAFFLGPKVTLMHLGPSGLFRIFGSREEDEVSGFFVLSHLWMWGYFRLSKG